MKIQQDVNEDPAVLPARGIADEIHGLKIRER